MVAPDKLVYCGPLSFKRALQDPREEQVHCNNTDLHNTNFHRGLHKQELDTPIHNHNHNRGDGDKLGRVD